MIPIPPFSHLFLFGIEENTTDLLGHLVPPKRNRIDPWEYDRERYKKRNEVGRLFRRLKGFRRIFSRFDKLDVVFVFFIHFALIIEALKSVNTS